MSENNKISLNLEKVSAILLDVAGTTTSIGFVKETLYPYITKNAEEFLKETWESEEIKKALEEFEEKELDVTKATGLVKTLTEKDDNNTGLKTIQGLIVKKGYEAGELKGHVFEDVVKCLESWSKSKKIAVFSSGSVESQQLLFKNSLEKDLTPHISKYFDESVGAKTESDTYKKIGKDLEVAPENILFLTDDVKEAEAAKAADVIVALVKREGNASIPEESLSNFTVITSFEDLSFETVKRKIEEESIEEPPSKIAKTEVTETAEEAKNEKDQTEEQAEKSEDQTEKETKTEEKCDEAMEVDAVAEVVPATAADATCTGKTEEEKPVVDNKEASETIEEKKERKDTSVKEESMEVSETVESETAENKSEVVQEKQIEVPEKKENKNEAEIGTQTKTITMNESEIKNEAEIGTQTKTITNECETQTTISITVSEDLPVKEVENKLMPTKSQDSNQDSAAVEKPKEEQQKEQLNKEKEVESEKDKCDKAQGGKIDEPKGVTEKESSKEDNKMEECPAEPPKAEETPSVEKENNEVSKIDEVQKKDLVDKKNITENKDIKDKVVDEAKVEEKPVVDEKVDKETDVKEKEVTEKETKVKEVTEKETKVKEVAEKDNTVEKEVKQSKQTATTEIKEKVTETCDIVPKENGVKSDKNEEVVEEKENKSELANGKETDVPNSKENGEASESSNGCVEAKDEEIKVKVIEDKVDSAQVSVEA